MGSPACVATGSALGSPKMQSRMGSIPQWIRPDLDQESGSSKSQSPKTTKNRWHLDVLVEGGRSNPLDVRSKQVEAEADRLVGLGASVLNTMDLHEDDHFAIAMQDPEGNEFDVV